MTELLVGVKGGPGARHREVLHLVNEIRRDRGLDELEHGDNLRRAATARARHLASTERLSHDGWERALREAGVHGRAVGENIAMGFRDPVDVVRGWMNSPGHRRNILDPEFAYMACAAAVDDDDDTWWCQLFAGGRG